MPIDLSLELEVNKARECPNIRNPCLDGNLITIDTDNGTYTFHADTGVRVGQESNDNPLRLRNKSAEVAVKLFQIWFGHKDWPKSDWRYLQDDSLYQFDNGKAANEKAKALNAESTGADAPWKFMVKSHTIMSPNHEWRSWMQARIDNAEYALMPWKDEPWYNADHFAHAAMTDPFKVAFVESATKGAEDVMTVLNPGRYLERFYSDHLNAQQIAAWAAKADSEAELCFAVTPEEIEDIYVNGGIDSCMKYPGDSHNFPLGIQPTRAYGAGDLQLAYLKRRGKIVGRALVWPEKKVIGRIYGDFERLKNRLVGEGYEYEEGNKRAFDGAKLLRIEIGGEVVLPYLDWSMGVRDMGDHLMICSSSMTWKGQTTNGTASGRSILICGHEGCRTVITDDGGFYNSQTGRQMCAPCADATLVRCMVGGGNYPMTSRGGDVQMQQIMRRDGQTPYPGFRGGYVHVDNLANGRPNANYIRINNVVYPTSECRIRPGTARTWEVLPVDA